MLQKPTGADLGLLDESRCLFRRGWSQERTAETIDPGTVSCPQPWLGGWDHSRQCPDPQGSCHGSDPPQNRHLHVQQNLKLVLRRRGWGSRISCGFSSDSGWWTAEALGSGTRRSLRGNPRPCLQPARESEPPGALSPRLGCGSMKAVVNRRIAPGFVPILHVQTDVEALFWLGS